MKKRQILWAIVFGSMLAITGCGDSDGGSGSGGSGSGGSGSGGSAGSAGSGGGTGSGFCTTLCEACGGGSAAECISACDSQLGGLPGGIDLESCPSELDSLATCFGANDCNGDVCNSELTAWVTCIISPF